MATAELEVRAVDDTLRWAHDELGLTYDQIGAVLKVSERTLRRWRSRDHGPGPRQKARLEDLHELRHVLDEVFPEQDVRREWLFSRSPMLRGRTPISLLRAGQVSRVVEALATLESGAFL